MGMILLQLLCVTETWAEVQIQRLHGIIVIMTDREQQTMSKDGIVDLINYVRIHTQTWYHIAAESTGSYWSEN